MSWLNKNWFNVGRLFLVAILISVGYFLISSTSGKSLVGAERQQEAPVATASSTQSLSGPQHDFGTNIVLNKSGREELRIPFRNITLSYIVTKKSWNNDLKGYDKALIDLENSQRNKQQAYLAFFQKTFSSQDETDKLIASFQGDKEQLNKTHTSLLNRRRSDEIFLDSTISSIKASSDGKLSQADTDTISQVEDNVRWSIEIYNNDLLLIEEAIKSKNDTIDSIQKKNIDAAINSLNDQDFIQLVLSWNDVSLTKLDLDRKDITNYLTINQQLRGLLKDTQKELEATSTATSTD